jgi:hypothetical protein
MRDIPATAALDGALVSLAGIVDRGISRAEPLDASDWAKIDVAHALLLQVAKAQSIGNLPVHFPSGSNAALMTSMRAAIAAE